MRERTSLGQCRERKLGAIAAPVLVPDSAVLDAAFGCRKRRLVSEVVTVLMRTTCQAWR